jgi:hypothetical protein
VTWGYYSQQFDCLLTCKGSIISADNPDDLHFVLGKLPGEPRQIDPADARPQVPWREWLAPKVLEAADAARARSESVWM